MTNPATLFGGLFFALLTACGGSAQPTIDLSAPGSYVSYPDSGSAPARQTVTFTVNAQDYNRCGNGHFGVMLRADTSLFPAGPYSGVGWIGASDLYDWTDVAMVESWAGPEQPTPPLLTPTISALPDGTFVVSVTSEKTPAGNTIRYTLGGFDSGAVLDPNPIVDMRRDAFAFFNASGPALCPYTLRISNLSTEGSR